MTKKQKLRAAEVLREARGIMAKKAQWCQGSWGRTAEGDDIEGEYVAANSPQAVSWCVQGAIFKAATTEKQGRAVVEELDWTVGENEDYFDAALELNDDNGDASRKKLCSYMTQAAKRLEREAANA